MFVNVVFILYDEAYEDMTDDEILAAIRTEHLKDSTVTIVLIGSETANRKWVDWEIYASLRPYGKRSRNGLLGIYLPTAGEAPARLSISLCKLGVVLRFFSASAHETNRSTLSSKAISIPFLYWL